MIYKKMMSYCVRFQDRMLTIFSSLIWIPPLLTRIALAGIFIPTGYGKIVHIEKVIGYFTSLGIPAPVFQAHLVAYTEFTCGILFLLGLFTRLASIPIIVTMSVALLTAHMGDIHGITDLFELSPALIIILCIWLLFVGAGKLSIDQRLRPKILNRTDALNL